MNSDQMLVEEDEGWKEYKSTFGMDLEAGIIAFDLSNVFLSQRNSNTFRIF